MSSPKWRSLKILASANKTKKLGVRAAAGRRFLVFLFEEVYGGEGDIKINFIRVLSQGDKNRDRGCFRVGIQKLRRAGGILLARIEKRKGGKGQMGYPDQNNQPNYNKRIKHSLNLRSEFLML